MPAVIKVPFFAEILFIVVKAPLVIESLRVLVIFGVVEGLFVVLN
jgi:hypothetical protein